MKKIMLLFLCIAHAIPLRCDDNLSQEALQALFQEKLNAYVPFHSKDSGKKCDPPVIELINQAHDFLIPLHYRPVYLAIQLAHNKKLIDKNAQVTLLNRYHPTQADLVKAFALPARNILYRMIYNKLEQKFPYAKVMTMPTTERTEPEYSIWEKAEPYSMNISAKTVAASYLMQLSNQALYSLACAELYRLGNYCGIDPWYIEFICPKNPYDEHEQPESQYRIIRFIKKGTQCIARQEYNTLFGKAAAPLLRKCNIDKNHLHSNGVLAFYV